MSLAVSPTQRPAAPFLAARLLVPAGAAIALLPAVSSSAALVAGVALALLLGNPYAHHTRRATKLLLPAAVVGLGGGMDLRTVLATGARGFGYTVVSIAACMAVGLLMARWLRLRGNTGLLITVGTAICGGSAIAAAAPVVRAEEHEISVALATVFVLNGLALLVFPPLGHRAGLDQDHFGIWAALAIHDTSSVVGASLQYGPRALAVATSIKLARALWIVPVTVGLALVTRRRAGVEAGVKRPPAAKPWFILWFVLVAALATYVPILRPAGHVLSLAAQRALVLVLFLIGANLSRDALRSLGLRPVALGVLLWVAMGTLSLAGIVAGLL